MQKGGPNHLRLRWEELQGEIAAILWQGCDLIRNPFHLECVVSGKHTLTVVVLLCHSCLVKFVDVDAMVGRNFWRAVKVIFKHFTAQAREWSDFGL